MKIFGEFEKYGELIERIALEAEKVLLLPSKMYIELDLISAEEMQEINKASRNIDKVTDVLSFPNLELKPTEKIIIKNYPFDIDPSNKLLNIGSIVICEEKVIMQAAEFNHSVTREFGYLFLHGLLHLLGFDHIQEQDKTLMRQYEEKVLQKLAIIN